MNIALPKTRVTLKEPSSIGQPSVSRSDNDTTNELGFSSLQFILFSSLSVGFWWFVSSNSMGKSLITLVFFTLAVLSTIYLLQKKLVNGLILIAYLVFLEPAIRRYGLSLPYLLFSYILPIWMILILVVLRAHPNFNAMTTWYGFYFLLDTIGLIQASLSKFSRTVWAPTFALFSLVLVGSQLKFTRQDVMKICSGCLVGILSIATIMSKIYFSGQLIVWNVSSNFQTSGGMGPNQVSMLMGIGVFFCIIFTIHSSYLLWRLFYIGCSLLLITVLLLTFSRGGFYLLLASILIYSVLNYGISLRSILGLLGFAAIVWFAFSVAQDTTQGKLVERFQEFNTSNRFTLLQHGWNIFQDNLLGVGTGNFYTVAGRQEYFGIVSGAHNELTRAMVEHGVPGIVIWLLFFLSVILTLLRTPQKQLRAFQLALATFFFLCITYNGLKLSSQSFLFFLSISMFNSDSLAKQDDSHE